MANILIYWPPEKIKYLLKANENIFFGTLEYIEYFSTITDRRERISVTEMPYNKVSSHFDVSRARNRLEQLAPIWTRWIGQSDQYEHYRAESLLAIERHCRQLENLDIAFVILHTAVPHHLDTSLIGIACDLVNIPLICLYPIVFDNRLLPLIYNGTDRNRSVLKTCCSATELYDLKIQQFAKNKESGNAPVLGVTLQMWKLSLLLAMSVAVRNHILNNVFEIINFIARNGSRPKRFHFPGLSLKQHLRLLTCQSRYLKSYEKKQMGKREVDGLINSGHVFLIIAAHFQPEATSFPEGGEFCNHIDIALSIRTKGYHLPILYKEHTATWMYLDETSGLNRVGMYRSQQYIDALAELNCKLLPKAFTFNVKQEECNWYVPLTITGTVAIERALFGFHTIVAGKPWYSGLPGTVSLSEIENLEVIPESWCKPDKQIAAAAKTFLEETINGNTISNATGVGLPAKYKDQDAWQNGIFQGEFNRFIKFLDCHK